MRIFASLMPILTADIPHWVRLLSLCVDGFHIDIMDGQFVPATHGSPELVSRIGELTDLPVWTHLMVREPEEWISRLTLRQGDIVSFHYEACAGAPTIEAALALIREKGGNASLALSPDTAVKSIVPYLAHLDQVLLMGVVPGKSGQAMLSTTKDRMETLHRLRDETCTNFKIALDGGITPKSLASLAPHVPDDLAAASSIIESENPCGMVAQLRKCV